MKRFCVVKYGKFLKCDNIYKAHHKYISNIDNINQRARPISVNMTKMDWEFDFKIIISRYTVTCEFCKVTLYDGKNYPRKKQGVYKNSNTFLLIAKS